MHAAWFQSPPWRLVDPELRLHTVKDDAALAALAKENGLQVNNLRHLIGLFAGNGSPAHVKRWQRLDQIRWIANEAEASMVPVPADSTSMAGKLGLGPTRLGRLLRGQLKSNAGKPQLELKGWRVVPPPAGAAEMLAAGHAGGDAAAAVGVPVNAAVVGAAVGAAEMEVAAAAAATAAAAAAAAAEARQQVEELETQRDQLLQEKEELEGMVQEQQSELEGRQAEYQRELADATREIDALQEQVKSMASAPAAGNVLKTMAAMGKVKEAQKKELELTAQLQHAKDKIEELMRERSKERFDGRHESHFMSQAQLDAGQGLRHELSTKRGAQQALEEAAAQNAEPEIGGRRINQLAEHIEKVLFGSGQGDVSRTQLILAAVLDRPVVQRLLKGKWQSANEAKVAQVSGAMLANARHVLQQLSSRAGGSGEQQVQLGSRSKDAHLAFETIIMALLPDNAAEDKMMRTVESLLGVGYRAVQRADSRKRKAVESGSTAAAVSAVLPRDRSRRRDARDRAREVCAAWWHTYTRMDTNPARKKRIRTGKGTYMEHWRHIVYDTNEEMAKRFFTGHEYSEYLESEGMPIKEDIFTSPNASASSSPASKSARVLFARALERRCETGSGSGLNGFVRATRQGRVRGSASAAHVRRAARGARRRAHLARCASFCMPGVARRA